MGEKKWQSRGGGGGGREGGKEFLSSLAKANTPFPPSFCVFPPSPAVLARSNAMVGGKVGV